MYIDLNKVRSYVFSENGVKEHELDPSLLLTVGQASEVLNLHPNTVRRWADNGTIPAVRVGPRGDRRLSVSGLRVYTEKQREMYGNTHISNYKASI